MTIQPPMPTLAPEIESSEAQVKSDNSNEVIETASTESSDDSGDLFS